MGDNVRPLRDRQRTTAKVRMTGQERRAQLLDVGRRVFAERGYEAASIEEIANRGGVSKPVVYEHFGGKEGLYAVVVDRETQRLLTRITESLVGDNPHVLLQQAADALLSYIEEESDGFRILVRDSPVAQSSGTFASLIGDVASQVEHLLAAEFKARGYDTELAPLYSQALVGMVAPVGQWWLIARTPSRALVAAHLVNLAWNGLRTWTPSRCSATGPPAGSGVAPPSPAGAPDARRRAAEPQASASAVLVPAEGDGRVVPAEPEAVGEGNLDLRLPGVRDVVQIALRVRSVRLMVGGSTPSHTASTVATPSTAPAAPTRCPVIDLVDETATRSAWSPRAARMALVSDGSPTGVEVPWALM